MAIARDQIRQVALPEEVVDVPEIGGEVIVRGFDMPRMLRFWAARRAAFERLGELPSDQQQEVAAGELVPLALHLAVLADDGQPVYTEAQWATFGAQHADVAMDLFSRVMSLSGADPAAEKKT
jgi:hypothetical protein